MNEDNLSAKRHSLAHLLAAAVLELYPDTKATIGPSTDNGFYYDFEFSSPISDKDLKKIEKKMRAILPTWEAFDGKEVSEKDALEHFKDNPYKTELIKEITAKGEVITFYTSGKFTDLCRGGHIASMKEIDSKSFTLSHVAGAYWRGNEKNTMLTRIYGLAFNTEADLSAYQTQIEEAKKRDHKKLGKELDLFTFSELIGPGLPLWTPKGTLLRDILDNKVWKLREKYGYVRVDIPHITKKDLYKKSGHWKKFSDELFHVSTREGHSFVLKPMNCPHHIQIFDRKLWSYRELPVRYASTTKVYRDEQSGELSGLSRVRSITQDDAHVFCRLSQTRGEIEKIWNIVTEFYETFGFTLTPRLSLHDPKNMEKYLGDESLWQQAEEELRSIVKEKGLTPTEAIGEAAFYGPKLDFIAKDSLGREWQVATIQLDTNLPERFDLNCTNEKGERERLVMIHAAIMGSLERFLSVVIEHYGGAFPLWLSPIQIKVLPISDSHKEYAEQITSTLKESGYRVELDANTDGLGKKIRSAKVEKIPYFIVIGDEEVKENKLTLESRDTGKVGQLTLADTLDHLSKN